MNCVRKPIWPLLPQRFCRVNRVSMHLGGEGGPRIRPKHDALANANEVGARHY